MIKTNFQILHASIYFQDIPGLPLHHPLFYQVNGTRDSEQRITYQQLEGLILLEGSCSATALTTIPEKRESNWQNLDQHIGLFFLVREEE